MNLNITPSEKFIKNLEYATKCFHELRDGEFVINSIVDKTRHRVVNYSVWLSDKYCERRHRNEIPKYRDLHLLFETYPNIEKFTFVGVTPEHIRDMADSLEVICDIFREIERKSKSAL